MRILWITGAIFPAPSRELGNPLPVYGGWMYNLAENLALSNNLAVATTYDGTELRKYIIDNVVYYLLPSKFAIKYDKKLEPIWKRVVEEFNPDIVHIHGTEYAPALACMHSCPSLKYIISIQGLINVISNYYFAGINNLDIIRNITFRDVVKKKTMFQEKKNYEKRGRLEKEYIQRTQHVIGRTSWDYAHIKAINSGATYHFCNESLRKSFYDSEKWQINNKTDYTIFISQASLPFKGLHQVLKAVFILKDEFPLINVRIAGYDITSNKTIKDKIRLSGYGKYLLHLIQKLNIHNQIQFVGTLSEEQMVGELQKAHVFICPSSVENSSNSLGEAQLLGVPVIASYVGGMPDMVVHGESGLLYRFEEVEMLTESIRQIFADNLLADKLSINGIVAAEKRHDLLVNLQQLICIYKTLMGN